MNLRDLEYFVKTAELQHFSKAAQAIFVSQPTLSMQIKKLEEELNVSLFHREGKKVRLTDAGQYLLPKAIAIIETSKEIKSMAKTLQNPFLLPLRLGVIPTIAPYFLPHLLPPLQQNLPMLNLILIEDKTETLLNQLQKNELDCALVALPILHRFNEMVLYEEPFLVAFPKDHALSTKDVIRSDDLSTENILMLQEGHCLREHALQFCDHFNYTEETYRASSLETLCQMVALGHGITLLPKFATGNRPQLVIRPFMPPVPSRKIGFIWKESSPRIKTLDFIGSALHEIFKAF